MVSHLASSSPSRALLGAALLTETKQCTRGCQQLQHLPHVHVQLGAGWQDMLWLLGLPHSPHPVIPRSDSAGVHMVTQR